MPIPGVDQQGEMGQLDLLGKGLLEQKYSCYPTKVIMKYVIYPPLTYIKQASATILVML